MRRPCGHQLISLATDLPALVEKPDDLENGFDLRTRAMLPPLRRQPAPP